MKGRVIFEKLYSVNISVFTRIKYNSVILLEELVEYKKGFKSE